MIKNKTILITGCNGEIGRCLIKLISKTPNVNIVALDLNISNVLNNSIEYISGSILDEKIIKKLFHTYDFDVIYHLAAVLSTKAEKKPDLAKDVNCNGTKLLIDYAIKKSYPTIFFFPSSIAIYSILEKKHTKHIHEDLYSNNPLTVYGKNKLFIEQYGIKRNNKLFDFRSLRFPGIISPFSIPTGGTSDYAPEMIHYAAQSLNYQCFASRDTTLPFIVMEDAICAITKFINTPRNQLTREAYNITSFSPTVEELYLETKKLVLESSYL